MRKILLVLSISSAFVIGFNACKSDDPEPSNNNGNNNPDPCTLVTYSNSIQAIVSANCTNSCHKPGAGSGNAENIDLTTYANVKAQAQLGSLINQIKHTANPVMPPAPAAKLADTTIAKFDCWKSNGFPQ